LFGQYMPLLPGQENTKPEKRMNRILYFELSIASLVFYSAVAVQPGQEQIYPEIAEDGGGKTGYGEDSSPFADPPLGDAGVKKCRVNEPDKSSDQVSFGSQLQ